MKGDKTLSATSQEILESWRILGPILRAWKNDLIPMQIYENGSWGPQKAESLIKEAGGSWISEYDKICRLDF
jgi:glucose-6-phosphate 1-dehydrogenase